MSYMKVRMTKIMMTMLITIQMMMIVCILYCGNGHDDYDRGDNDDGDDDHHAHGVQSGIALLATSALYIANNA